MTKRDILIDFLRKGWIAKSSQVERNYVGENMDVFVVTPRGKAEGVTIVRGQVFDHWPTEKWVIKRIEKGGKVLWDSERVNEN